jgi:hypothetical protein
MKFMENSLNSKVEISINANYDNKMVKFLNFIIILFIQFIFVSCYSFEKPQPIDGKDINSIPGEFIGTYYPESGKTSLEKYVISKNQLESFMEKEDGYSKVDYFSSQGKHFVSTSSGNIELFFPSFSKDSVYGKSIEKETFLIGENLIIKKIDKNYVVNLKENNADNWYVNFVLPNNEGFTVYYLKSDHLNTFKHNSDRVISEHIYIKDIKYYFSRKNKFLENLIEFNVKKKTYSKKF